MLIEPFHGKVGDGHNEDHPFRIKHQSICLFWGAFLLSLFFFFIIPQFMKSVKLTQYLYTASLFFLIFLTAVCVAISAADVVIQALTDKTNTGQFDYRNLIVVGGSYLLLVIGCRYLLDKH